MARRPLVPLRGGGREGSGSGLSPLPFRAVPSLCPCFPCLPRGSGAALPPRGIPLRGAQPVCPPPAGPCHPRASPRVPGPRAGPCAAVCGCHLSPGVSPVAFAGVCRCHLPLGCPLLRVPLFRGVPCLVSPCLGVSPVPVLAPPGVSPVPRDCSGCRTCGCTREPGVPGGVGGSCVVSLIPTGYPLPPVPAYGRK